MNRHPRRGDAGFSFVELLITIVIAGVAFAAMVPLFVQAQNQTSADNARNVALQIAQDKIEKVRQLDYEQITPANLSDDTGTFAGGQFGSYWDFIRNGSTKRYAIAYTVTPVLSANNQEQYKKVIVSVTWTAPPSPVKAAVLQTFVYRQYAGPVIESVTVGPPGIYDPTSPDSTTIVAGPVEVDVTISPEDVSSMDATNVDPDARGWVNFTVTSFTGVTVASEEVNAVYNGELGHYRFVWDNSAAQDGVYKLEMTAYSASEMQGSTATLSFYVELNTPPAPTGLVAIPGDSLALLSWDPSVIGDLDHYELWRGTSSGGEVHLVDVPKEQASYTDTGLSNGTTYYYTVRVVDTGGNSSLPSVEASVTPAVPSDTIAPSVPMGLAAVKVSGAPTINLSWTASVDYGSPASGVAGYVIERSPNGASGWIELQSMYPNTAYPDSSAGWSSTWYYRVAAIDNNANVSAFSAPVGPLTTDAQPRYSLTVNNTRGVSIYVWVQNPAGTEWYATDGTVRTTKPAGVQIKKNKSQIWSNLLSGVYNVVASTSSSGSPQLPSAGGSGDLSAGNNTISF